MGGDCGHRIHLMVENRSNAMKTLLEFLIVAGPVTFFLVVLSAYLRADRLDRKNDQQVPHN